MSTDRVLRSALWISVPFNGLAAILLLFPDSFAGQLAGLPAEPVPLFYRATLAFFVAMFGGLYAWIALQPKIPRALIGFSALGKAGVFVLVAIFVLCELAPPRAVLTALGDGVLAAVFADWLLRSRTTASAR